jgi:hypothetical protein
VRPATIIGSSRSSAYSERSSAATHKGDDFELVAVGEERVPELRALQDAPVPLDRDPGRVEAEPFEERLDGKAGADLARLAVQDDADGGSRGYFFSSFLFVAR